MMTKEAMITSLKELLIEEFELEHDLEDPSQNLIKALDIDSLDTIDLVVLVEKNFGYKLTKDDLLSAKTMENFYTVIYTQLSA
jgi:acyl carrier protein